MARPQAFTQMAVNVATSQIEVGNGIAAATPVEGHHDLLDSLIDHCGEVAEEVGLGLEVRVEASPRQAHLGHDVLFRGVQVTVAGEHCAAGIEQALAGTRCLGSRRGDGGGSSAR